MRRVPRTWDPPCGLLLEPIPDFGMILGKEPGESIASIGMHIEGEPALSPVTRINHGDPDESVAVRDDFLESHLPLDESIQLQDVLRLGADDILAGSKQPVVMLEIKHDVGCAQVRRLHISV